MVTHEYIVSVYIHRMYKVVQHLSHYIMYVRIIIFFEMASLYAQFISNNYV